MHCVCVLCRMCFSRVGFMPLIIVLFGTGVFYMCTQIQDARGWVLYLMSLFQSQKHTQPMTEGWWIDHNAGGCFVMCEIQLLVKYNFVFHLTTTVLHIRVSDISTQQCMCRCLCNPETSMCDIICPVAIWALCMPSWHFDFCHIIQFVLA